jgi:aspartyl-tRNA(Asn)/glutamyl-tRNA(Gln) amidotransferase subunit C
MSTPPTITQEEVRRVAHLARLTLHDDEVIALQRDMEAMLGYVAQLQDLDLDGVEPTTHTTSPSPSLRPDEPRQTLSRDQVLQNAPEQEGGMFRVPRIVEGGN